MVAPKAPGHRVREVFKDGGGSLGARTWSANVRTDGSHSGDGGQDVLRGLAEAMIQALMNAEADAICGAR